jgi:gliding motility-associated-like protein
MHRANTNTCSFTVTVNDTQNPAITCPANITQANDLNVCGANITYATPVGTDNCPAPVTTLTAGQASGTVFPIGTTTVTYLVTDASANTNTCSFTVTVNDTQNPAITCPADITQNNDAGVCGANIVYATPVGTDNCPAPVTALTAGQASGTVFPVGTTTVTYTVTDASSNTATCSFDVTVDDTENPTIVCPANITQNNDAGVCGATIVYATPVGTDNCPGAVTTLTAGQASGTVFPIGTTTVTYEVADASANTNTCSFTVTVNDTQNPSIVCPANITQSNSVGVCGATIVYATPVGTDNCPAPVTTLTAGQASGTVFPIGTTTVTYLVTDASANTNTCSFTVTVNDTQNPAITCPANITQANDLNVCGANITYATPVGTDNCPAPVTALTAGQASGTVFPIGTTTVTYLVTDASANTNTCSFTVTVNDTQNPAITCPADITQNNDAGVCGANIVYATPVGTDNCPAPVTALTAGQASGTVFPVGTTTVTYTVTDASSNTATCSFDVTVDDTENPAIVCPANITQNNDAGVCGATIVYATPVGTDNCPGAVTTLTAGQASGTVFPIGTTTVTYEVADASANTNTCSFTVTVNDTQNPSIVCPANITQSNSVGVCGATIVYATPVGTDNCPAPVTTLTAGQASGTVFPIGTTTVTYLVTDASANTNTCSFTVTVNDTQNPAITCPANITQANDLNVCGANITYATPVGTDNCPAPVTTLTAGQASGTVFPIGTTTVTYLVTDASANTNTCSFTVTVNDTQNPAITCPADITQNNDAGVCGANIVYATPVGTDNCPAPVTALTAGQASGTVFPVGTTTVTYTVTDASSNTATCSFDVTVDDTENPTIVCPANMTQANDLNVCGATITYATPVGLDNCPAPVTALTAGQASGTVFPIGTTTVTYEVTDASSNTATCSFDVTVNDTQNPAIVCPANITQANDLNVCGANITYATPVGTDNCPAPITTLTAGQASGTVFPIGTTTVTYLVTDASANTNTCSFTVTVNDTQNPAITCPANITQANDLNVCGANITYATPVGTDNCPAPVTTLTAGQASGTVFPIGTTTVTYLVTDASANTNTCSFTVTVNDTQNPAITCPADITQNNDAGVCGANIVYATPVGTDNCPAPVTALTAGQASGTVFPVGTTTVTYTVTDASSNTATCSFDVTVDDTENPTIVCPANMTQANDLNVCGATITYATPVGLDNCPAPVTALTAGQASGTVFPIGTTTVTYEVTDASSNTATCSFDVTVNDTQNPAIVCPANITQANDLNVCGANITYATPVGTDNCPAPITTLTAGQASGTVFPIGTTTVTYLVTDASANTNTCSFTVTVNDTQNPAITCPANITQANDLNVCGANITYATPVGTDNCPAPVTTLTAGQASGTVFPIGTTTVTYLVTDASANTNTCSFTVTVNDTQNPAITCPADITQNNDAGVCGANIVYATPVGTDNCPAPVTALTAGQASGTVFPVGTTTVTYTVNDASSNTATCSFDVTVNDAENPTIVCPANITQNNDLNVCGANITYATPVGLDNCPGSTTILTVGQASGTIFPIGTTTVTYFVFDASSNTNSCSFTVTVNDTQNPAITCPANITQANDLNVCGANITYATPVGTDNCPAPITTLTAGQASGTVFPIGTTTVTYLVTDASANTNTCSFTVTVNDTQNPAITCPANITQANDLNVCGANITYATPVGTDNCPAPVTTLTAGQASGTVFPIGTTTVTYLVTDASANINTCSFTVTVDDTQNPAITCPADITQNNDAGVCGANIVYATPVGTDNCPAPVTALTAGQASGTVFPVGTTTVTYTVTDASSNTATCSFDVTVNDAENPTIVCPANMTQANDLNVCGANITYATPVGTDNCPAPVTALTAGQASGTVFPIGTTTVTYEVTDASSNTATCSFDVTVNDTQNPAIVCPANITQANDLNVCGANITYATPVGTDNCPAPITTLTAGQASGTVFPIGTTTVTYLVTDASANTNTCSFTVTVNDTQNPAITCPANITQANDLNVCGANITYATPVGTDNCPAPVTALTAGQASGTVFPIGTTTVTYLVTDASANTNTCSFTVTVDDTQNPAITCPADITQNNDAGVCGANIVYATPVGTDNCPAPVTALTAGQASGTVFPVGTTTVTYTVTDASSNTATCSFDVTVDDTENPTIVCPANMTQANDLNVCGANITYATPVGLDNCPGSTTILTVGQASGTIFPIGTTTVTYFVFDASSNTNSCSFTVTVNDTQNPAITCPANITQANDLNVCGANITYATPVGTDNCPAPITTLTAGQASGTVFPIGTTTVTYLVTDASANTNTCSFTVTVNDTQNPAITCPANITQANDLNVCGANITYATPVGTDNCPAPVTALTAGQASGTVFPIGTTTVTYLVTDASANTNTCSFTVTVNDTQNPAITCPADITQNNDAGVCGANIVYATPVGTDNCPAPVTALTAGQASGTVFPVGTTTVTYTVTDASSNTATCSFDVTVNDAENPTIVCPANITQNNDLNVCGANITYATPVGLDNCPGSTTILTVGQASGTIFPIGTTTVTYFVFDASSNTNSCSFTVTVNDTQNPAITCPANITQANDLNVCGANITYATPVGTDNCPAPITTLTAGQASGTVFPIGTTTVTYLVTDASANTNTCSFTVTVNDTQNPAITCPANITQANDLNVCGANITYATPVGTDNCPAPVTTLTAGQASGTVFPIGTTTVTYLVTDASANINTCSFTVTVDDTQNPAITCPADITQNNDAGVCGANIVYATPVGTDNCPAPVTALTAGQASGTVFPVGTTTVTYTVTDASSNTATCSFDVTVNDTENPTIVCPANITQNNDLNVCGANITYATPVGLDNCPGSTTILTVGQASGTIFPIGTTTVTYFVFDASSNTNSCSFTVTVNDTQNPAITCPANITQANDLNVCGANITYATPVGTDNCPAPITTLTAGQASGTVFPIGTTTVTYLVTDASANTNTCSFTVTVNDTQNPAITCPANITQANDLNVCGANITYATPVGTDNCPAPVTTLTAGQASGTVFPIGTTTVTYLVTDASANTNTCSFTVTVNDTQNPAITCPADITQNNDAGVCGANIVYATPVGTDNCPAPVTALTAGQASGTVFPVGTTTVTYTVNDASSNTATCSFDVTVNDAENPTIVCPANITQNNDLNVCGANITYATPVGLDNCPGSTTILTVGQASGTIFPIGTTTVTYFVFDASSNTNSCSFTVTVNDTQNPAITCPANITQANDLNVCGANITYATPVGTDNCPAPITTLTAGQASGTVFPIGTTTVTYLVTDASANTNTCSFTVTVNDTQNPAITCPANITQANDLNVCGANITYATPVGTDNCPAPVTTLTAGQASGTVFPIGTTTVTYLVTDASANINTCSFTVTVDDTQNPAITCPADITQNNDAGVCGANIVYATPVGTDNCPGSTTLLTLGQASGTIFPIGTTTVTYFVFDASSNTNTCSFNVTVNDSQLPAITCPSNITQANDFNVCGANITYATPVGTDNCPASVTTLAAGQASGTVFPIGTTTVTYQVTDASSNLTTCSFNVTVNDTQIPLITCPSNITQNNDFNVCGANITYATPVGTDNCPASLTTLIAGQASGTIFPVGATTVTYQVTDASSNNATCSFTVTINDTQNPVITCPSSINQPNDPGICGAPIFFSSPVGTDNCPGTLTFQTAGLPSGSVFPIGTTVISYLAADVTGNIATCNFTITVNDSEDPVIICPPSIVQSNDAGICGASIAYGTPLGNDNCPGSITVMTTGLPSGSVFPIGTTNVSFSTSDVSGNTSSCSFTVTIIDTEAPGIVCPSDQNVSLSATCDYTIPDYVLMAISGDNCGVLSVNQNIFPGTVITTTTPVTITATDIYSNVSSCTFNVIPTDNTAPTITCPGNQSVYVDAFCNYTANDFTSMAVSADNCGVISISQVPLPGSTLSSTVLTTLTASDATGNNTSCTFNIVPIDTITPQINCPIFPVADFFDASCQFTTPDYASLVSIVENCGPYTITQSPAIGASLTASQIITMTVTDTSGISNSCVFDLILSDTIAPVISCPVDQIDVLNDTCHADLEDYTGLAVTTANCEVVIVTQSPTPGTVFNSSQTIILTGTDANGNSSACFFNVDLIDTIRPVISCPADIVTCDNVVNYATPTATDNCGVIAVTRIAGLASGSFFADGIHIITYVAEDAFGNTDTCSFNIIVNEKPDPTATSTLVTCAGFSNGTVDLTVAGGNPPYTYIWSNSATTEDLNGVPGGTYTVFVYDSKGCYDSLDIFVFEPLPLDIGPTVEDVTCYNASDGSIVVAVGGGVPGYNFNWTPSYFGNNLQDLPGGTYSLHLVDAMGCVFDTVFTLTNPDSILITADISQYPNGWQISCEGCYDGWIDTEISGGTGGYNIDWSEGSITEDLNGLPAGTYTIIVTDDNGCTNEATFILDQPLAVVMSDAFSPNGDGLNDYFQIKNIDRYPNNMFTVMNRWGSVVYKAAPYTNDWYGECNSGLVLYGNEVPEGSYYFILDLKDGSDPIKGYIVINR